MRPDRHLRRSPRAAAFALLVALTAACNQTEAIRKQALEESSPVTFSASDGVQLSGRVFGPDHARTGVVLAHMLPADQSSWFEFADVLAGNGYGVLTFDFRGYCPGGDAGCSEGTKDYPSIWKDVAGAVSFLQGRGARTIALVGASMGGTASLIVAGQEPSAIAAVITLSAPQSIQGLTVTLEVLAGASAAKLFIAGDGDGVAAQTAQLLYDGSSPPKSVQIVTSGDHGTDLLEGNQAEIVRKQMLTWLEVHAPA
ncbi:MAG TPA: alpha/beta fold hydrolase [Actinomycetota bacterium]